MSRSRSKVQRSEDPAPDVQKTADPKQEPKPLFPGHSASDFGPGLGEGLPPIQVQDNGGE
jgi:hypothetical protein